MMEQGEHRAKVDDARKVSNIRDLPRSWCITAGICVMLFFFFPASFQAVSPIFHSFVNIGVVVSSVVSLGIYIALRRIEPFGILMLALALASTVTVVVNGGTLDVMLLSSYWPLAAVALLAYALVPKHGTELLRAILIVAGAYAVANLMVVCFVPVGTPFWHPSSDNTFISYRNGFCRYYFPAIAASLLLDQGNGKRASVRSVLLLIISYVQSALAYSATSMMALVAFTIAVILIQWKRPRCLLNAFTYLGAYGVAFVAIVLFRVQGAFSPALDSLGRSVTFTGRTLIWDKALALVDGDHFLLGRLGTTEKLFTLNSGQSVSTAHNAVLDIITWGGFLALALFAAVFVLAAFRLFKQRTDAGAAVLAQYLGAFLLMGMFEYITCTPLFLFLGIACAWRGAPANAIEGSS